MKRWEKGLEDGAFSRIVKRDPDENEEVQSRGRPPSRAQMIAESLPK